jgi:hypothetical protein
MTANQIAAESNRIQKEVADRQQTEINRHNTAMEDLEQQKVATAQEANDIQRFWNDFQIQWKKDYEAKWREWELSQGDERLRLQDELQNLDKFKAETDATYKDRLASNQEYLASLEKRRLDLDAEFKQFQESAKWAELGLTEKDQAIRRKQLEYDYSLRHEYNLIQSNFNTAQMDYKWASMNWEREQFNRRLAQDYSIAMNTYDLRAQELDLNYQRLSLDQKNSAAQRFNLITSGLFGKSGIIPGTMYSINQGFGLIGGSYEQKKTTKLAKTAAEAAAALFTD